MVRRMEIEPIAYIRNDFKEKFGIPRQSNLIGGLKAEIVFEPAFRNADARRGLEDFSHIWLLWEFSQAKESMSPTVRPPRLGGNRRMGVFATRSPFRPNPIGLSCVHLLEIRQDPSLGPVLVVGGADLMDGTPIIDIKPYLPQADCVPDATGGFTDAVAFRTVAVHIPAEIRQQYDALTAEIEELRAKRAALLEGADLPYPGLSVQDGKLTLDGKAWDCMSGSMQLGVATAIAARLAPDCKFVLVDKLEQLDANTLAEYDAYLRGNGLQCIGTRVSTGGECSIVIEDGMVAGGGDAAMQNAECTMRNGGEAAEDDFTLPDEV